MLLQNSSFANMLLMKAAGVNMLLTKAAVGLATVHLG
jgi:hypothetical protein